jgi:hypothetical protein
LHHYDNQSYTDDAICVFVKMFIVCDIVFSGWYTVSLLVDIIKSNLTFFSSNLEMKRLKNPIKYNFSCLKVIVIEAVVKSYNEVSFSSPIGDFKSLSFTLSTLLEFYIDRSEIHKILQRVYGLIFPVKCIFSLACRLGRI